MKKFNLWFLLPFKGNINLRYYQIIKNLFQGSMQENQISYPSLNCIG